MSRAQTNLNDLPDALLLLIFSSVPPEPRRAPDPAAPVPPAPALPRNRHALPSVSRRWRALLDSPDAAALWAAIDARVPSGDGAGRAVAGMFRWFSRHGGAVKKLSLTIEEPAAAAADAPAGAPAPPSGWAAAHGVLAVAGGGLRELRLTVLREADAAADADAADGTAADAAGEGEGEGEGEGGAVDGPAAAPAPRRAGPPAAWLAFVPGLTSLELRGARPAEFEDAALPPGLAHLELVGRGAEGGLPRSLAALSSLTSLSLADWEPGAVGGDDPSSLYAPLASLAGLRALDLSNNALRELPPAVAALSALSSLVLSENEGLGATGCALDPLASLARLERLELRACGLRRVPPQALGLAELRSLLIGYNDLTPADADGAVLPPGAYLAKLELLGMSDCAAGDEPLDFVAALAVPLRAAPALACLRLARNWALPIEADGVAALLEGKRRFARLEFSQEMADEGLDLDALRALHARVEFVEVD
jgi:hypothetical protein